MKKSYLLSNLHSNLRNSRGASKSCLHSNNLRNLRNLREPKLILAICGSLILTSCAHTQYVALPEIHTLYHHATDLRVDSTSRDRWHEVFTRGDTVFVHDSIDRWHYRFINTTDTVHQTDSVPYPVEVPVYIRQRNLYDRITSWGFWLLFIGILLSMCRLFLPERRLSR